MNIIPTISVLMPVYNASKYLEESINSILEQTFRDFELVIIDDGSIDISLQILEKYKNKDSRIKIYFNEKNIGLIGTLNIGLERCTGKYIARMDADDISYKNRLEMQIKFLEANPDYSAVSSWMQTFGEDGTQKIIHYRTDIDFIKCCLFFYSPVSHAASIFKAEVLKELKYDPQYIYAEDYDLWYRFLKEHKVGVIEQPLYLYRIHNQQSTNERNHVKAIESIRSIIKKIYADLDVSYIETDIDRHVEFFVLNKPICSPQAFMVFNQLLIKLLGANKKKGIFHKEKWIDMMFLNYWQRSYDRLSEKFTIVQRINLCFSPVNKYGKRKKMADLLGIHDE